MCNRLLPFCLVLAAVAAPAAPIVNNGGVVNGASYIPAALPHGAIAHGSIIAVFGTGLGPDNVALVSNFPLPTELAETSVQITSGGTTLNAFILYTKAMQVGAILPSKTPTGTASLTVTYKGETSAPVSFQVVKSTFGIFTANTAGSGPAAAHNFNSIFDQPFNSIINPARPGQVVTLWGTGLGPIVGDDNQPPQMSNLNGDVTVLVGGQSAQIQYQGRTPCCAGEDQINFVVPSGVEGCYLPVTVKVDGVPSNFGTIAVASSGTTCSDPASFSAADLQKIQAGADLTVGMITLWPGIDFPEETGADFGHWDAAKVLQKSAGVAVGQCLVHAGKELFYSPDLEGPLVDAGLALTITGPKGSMQMAQGIGFSQYSVFLDRNFFVPGGSYTVSGPDGADVGPIQAVLDLPSPLFNWTNIDTIQNIPRSQDLLVSWIGGDPNSFVHISGYSDMGEPSINVYFQCIANAGAGQFAVPSAILSLLPSTSLDHPNGSLTITNSVRARFQASGLDFGFIGLPTYFYKQVTYK